MYPQTLYCHLVTIIEIISGMFWLAVITGLIFVRFSRPTARILFSKSMVIAPFDGQPSLMLRVANLRFIVPRDGLLYTRALATSYGGQFLKIMFTSITAPNPALKGKTDKVMESVRLEE
jgi:inward rectifier potassium channel